MKKGNKKRIAVVALILLIIALCPTVLGAIPQHTSEFYVNDFAGVLSSQTEQEIQSTAISLSNETTAQVCVLTIDTLDGEDIAEYSVEVFRDWGIGDKEKNNGVLILLSIQDREMWISTGYGVEGTLTDARLGQLRDTYAIPYYSNDDFDTGTLQLFNAIVNELRVEEYGLSELENFENIEYYSPTDKVSNSFSGIVYVFIYISIMLVAVAPPLVLFAVEIKSAVLRSYDKKHGTYRAQEYEKKAAKIKKYMFALWILSRRNRHGSSHRHHSSGGGFHGGGFGGGGGFRGGGGSTGGGGAGGRF